MQITLCNKPEFPKKKLSPQQQAGLTYERKVFKFFRQQKRLLSWPGNLMHSPWFKVEDSKTCFLNPDILLIGPKMITVFECKLSQTSEAFPQLRRYGEVCKTYFGLPVNLILVFRNLYHSVNLITNLPRESHPREFFSWHLFL